MRYLRELLPHTYFHIKGQTPLYLFKSLTIQRGVRPTLLITIQRGVRPTLLITIQRGVRPTLLIKNKSPREPIQQPFSDL